MGFFDDFKTRNFGLYGQWFALLSTLFCFALGIANVLSFSWLVFFGAFALISTVLIIVIEIPFLARRIDGLRHIEKHIHRAGFYLVLAIVLWLSLIIRISTLIVAASFLTITAFWYALAAWKKQEFITSSMLGGTSLVSAGIRNLAK